MTALHKPLTWSTLALAASGGLLAYRFANFDLVPFIQDEPIFLRAAATELATGHWLSASPIPGTQGVTYGPTVCWLYAIVQFLFGSAPVTAIWTMCLLVTLSHLALAWALTDFFDGDRWLFAALLGWIAASPFQFFWSRLAWDQTVDIAAAWVVVILTRRSRFSVGRGGLLGVVLGLALSSHLMVVPLVSLTLAFVAWRTRATGFWPLAACVAALFGVNVPYLRYLATAGAHLTSRGPLDWRWFGEQLIQPVRVSSLLKVSYFFDAEWHDFVGNHVLLMNSVIALSVIVPLGLTALGFTAAMRDVRRRAFAVLALSLWLLTAAFHFVQSLPRQPHYMFACYWVVGFAVASAISALRSHSTRAGAMVGAALALCLTLQAGFIVLWMRAMRTNQGTNGVHYGTPLRAQWEAVEETCAASLGDVTLVNRTALFNVSLQYLADDDPRCAGEHWHACLPGECPNAASAGGYVLQYAEPRGGRLKISHAE